MSSATQINNPKQTQYDGVNASPYDDPAYKTEMAFRYSNYNPDTNTFRVDLYSSFSEKTKPCEMQPYEWEHFDDKEDYERTDHTEKEKWILERAKEKVEEYQGYPAQFKDYTGVNKLKYEDCDFANAELWIDYNERIVYMRLYFTESGLGFHERLDLDDLEENYYEEVESNFLYNVKGFKEDIIYYLDEYTKDCAEDFIERVKIDEEEEDFNQDMAIVSFIELMKAGFTDWLQNHDEDYKTC